MHLVKLNLLRRISQVDQDFVSVIALLQGKAVVPEAMKNMRRNIFDFCIGLSCGAGVLFAQKKLYRLRFHILVSVARRLLVKTRKLSYTHDNVFMI